MHKARICVRLRVESAALKVVHNQISIISSRTWRGRASARRAGKMLAEQWPPGQCSGFAVNSRESRGFFAAPVHAPWSLVSTLTTSRRSRVSCRDKGGVVRRRLEVRAFSSTCLQQFSLSLRSKRISSHKNWQHLYGRRPQTSTTPLTYYAVPDSPNAHASS